MKTLQDSEKPRQRKKPIVHKYMDMRLDWAFKYILLKKEVLLKLLNDILPLTITDLSYLPNEIPVMSDKDKRSSLDVICESPDGQFLVEMQRKHTADIDDRLAYYQATLIQRQVKRKNKTYRIKHVYVLCIASSVRNHSVKPPRNKILFSYDYQENETHELLENSKASVYFLELSRMKERDWEKLRENPERWCFLFKNMSKFAKESDVPVDLHGFEDVLEAARIDKLSPEDMDNYQDMLTAVKNEVRSARLYDLQQARKKGEAIGEARGEARGVAKEKVESARRIARAMRENGLEVDLITKCTGLPAEEIAAL